MADKSEFLESVKASDLDKFLIKDEDEEEEEEGDGSVEDKESAKDEKS